MYSFASHGYGSDRIFCPFPDWLKNKLNVVFVANPKTEVLKSKDLNTLQVIHVSTLWKLGKNFKRKSDSNSHKKFQQLWEFAMIRFSVLWAYKAKTSSEAICETVGKALWVIEFSIKEHIGFIIKKEIMNVKAIIS